MSDGGVENLTAGPGISGSFDRLKKRLNLCKKKDSTFKFFFNAPLRNSELTFRNVDVATVFRINSCRHCCALLSVRMNDTAEFTKDLLLPHT